MDHVISELCYKETALHINYREMTILEPVDMAVLYSKPCYNE